jgi:hypothetical protein
MKVQVWSAGYVEVDRTAKRRIAKAEDEGLCKACMFPLDDTRTIRHCHERCWRATRRAILRGECTDEERVAEGKLGEIGDLGRVPTNPVTVELRKR